MSWRDAPVYVEAHDLSRWVLDRCAGWETGPCALLRTPVSAASTRLLISLSLALTFPITRAAHLERADEAIVELRTLLRLVQDLGGLSASQQRFAAGRLQAIGRMVGGWKKRVRRTRLSGGEPPPATTASTAAAASTTRPTGHGPPIATGTTTTMPTTTRASASTSPNLR